MALKNILDKNFNLSSENSANGKISLEKVISRYENNICCPRYMLIIMDIDMPVISLYSIIFILINIIIIN